jgi:hypothetical protein
MAVVGLVAAGPQATSNERLAAELAPPIKIESAGAPIDVEIGHAAPFFADVTGDGNDDLLVGQFSGGKLRVYKNVGTAGKPRFDGFFFLPVEPNKTGGVIELLKTAVQGGQSQASVPAS